MALTGRGMGLHRALQLSTEPKASPVSQDEGMALPACMASQEPEKEGKSRQLLLLRAGPPYLSLPGSRRATAALQAPTARPRYEGRNEKPQPGTSITKYLMFSLSKGSHTLCALCAQMLSDYSSCERSTRTTQQNADNYSSAPQQKLKPELQTVHSRTSCTTFISF